VQDLLVLGVIPGTDYVIPLYFWVVFGFVWIIVFWNIDKIHLHRRQHAHGQAQVQSVSTSMATPSTSALATAIATLVGIGRTTLAKLVVGLSIAAHLIYKVLKKYVVWADKKANSVHASDLKKIMTSNE